MNYFKYMGNTDVLSTSSFHEHIVSFSRITGSISYLLSVYYILNPAFLNKKKIQYSIYSDRESQIINNNHNKL